MTRWPSSLFAVDYHPKEIQQENEERFPPRSRPSRLPEGQDFESLTAKYGRPIGPFEKGRCHPYRASGNSTVASSEWTEAPPENIGAQ
jgi:hypothetical protein